MKEEDEEHMLRRLADQGGTAFPRTGYLSPMPNSFDTSPQPGMTLRQWYVGKAISGLLAQNNRTDEMTVLAKQAFRAADALIAFEREEAKSGK